MLPFSKDERADTMSHECSCISKFLEVIGDGRRIHMWMLARPACEERLVLMTVEFPQLLQHCLQRFRQGHQVLLLVLHA